MEKEEDELLNILALNDDCLESVFKELEFTDQIKVAQVCQRFKELIVRLWARNPLYKTLCFRELHLLLPNDEVDQRFYLQAMQGHIVHVEFFSECLNSVLCDMEDFNINCFSAAQHCEFQREWALDCYPSDDDIKALTKLMPNLTYLRLTAPISGKHLLNLKELQELYFYEDRPKEFEISNENFSDICLNLSNLRVLDIRTYEKSNLKLTHIGKLQKLEVLRLNVFCLKTGLAQVLALPRLKTLSVLLDFDINYDQIQNVDNHNHKIYETAEFYEILAAKAAHITSLCIDNYYMPLQVGWDDDLEFLKFKKLKLFACCNWDFGVDMLQKYTNMTELKVLSLRNCTNLNNATLLEFIKLCPRLEHIDVSYCEHVNRAFIQDALNILKRQKRQNVTYVHYFGSGFKSQTGLISEQLLVEEALPLKLTSLFPPNSDAGLSYFERGYEFEFE